MVLVIRVAAAVLASWVVVVLADPEYYPDFPAQSDDYASQLSNFLKNEALQQKLSAENVRAAEEYGPLAMALLKPRLAGPGPLDYKYPSEYKRHESRDKVDKDYDYDAPLGEPDRPYDSPTDEEFTYRLEPDERPPGQKTPFAVSPVDPRYYQQIPTTDNGPDLKRAAEGGEDVIVNTQEGASSYEIDENDDNQYVENSFEEPRQQRQNPNLAANKINKVISTIDFEQNEGGSARNGINSKFNAERDIPTSLVPTSSRHQYVIQEALKQNPRVDETMNIYIYAIIAGIAAAATIAIAAFAFGWYTMQKRSKAAADVEYPAYGVTGPNTDVSPSGDRRLAHSAQMYHYQHQKQQIIAMESRAGVAERNGSVSDAESEDENEEGDYTVYECPGFATTGEMEVKNPLFLDEPTPATPAQQNQTSATAAVGSK